MSEVGIKKYVVFSLLISIGLSVIKGFKYSINYDGSEIKFPISNEFDIINYDIKKPSFFEAFFIVNFIFDILNYMILVIICSIIDIYMVVKLRAFLEDKNKSKAFLNILDLFLNVKDLPLTRQQNKDWEERISKTIKIVVINTLINFVFRVPITFLPTVDVYAQFYFKKEISLIEKPLFKEFYLWLIYSGSFLILEDLLDLLYCFSISIQFFIYRHFDVKF